jgi:hypothetical protein
MSTIHAFQKTKEQVADKVRKLLAQAEDPAATPEEAHAFTMKAQHLMSKYSIGLAMVADPAHADELVETGWTVEGPYAGHKVDLINSVSRANDCRAIYCNLAGGRKHISVIGYPADVEWVQTLSRSLAIQLDSALLSAIREKPQHVHGRTFAVGFAEGFTAEVRARLRQARQSAIDAAEAAREAERAASPAAATRPEADTGSVALVLVAKQARVEEEFKVRHPGSRTVYSNTRLRSWAGYAPGRAAGRRASLARGSVDGGRRSLSA